MRGEALKGVVAVENLQNIVTFVRWTPHHLSLLLGVVVVDFSEAKFRLERHSLH